jgi:hypothetical protein
LRDQIHARRIEHRIAIMRDQRPVEVGAEKANRAAHRLT